MKNTLKALFLALLMAAFVMALPVIGILFSVFGGILLPVVLFIGFAVFIGILIGRHSKDEEDSK